MRIESWDGIMFQHLRVDVLVLLRRSAQVTLWHIGNANKPKKQERSSVSNFFRILVPAVWQSKDGSLCSSKSVSL